MKKLLNVLLSFISSGFKTKIVMLAISATFIACNKDALEVKKLTFEDIQTEFNFPKPLSEYTRAKMLEKFGSVENYRTFVKSIFQEKKSLNQNYYSITAYGNKSNNNIADSILCNI